MCIKSDNTLALGIIKNNVLLFLIIPRAWALSYTYTTLYTRVYNTYDTTQ